VYCIQSSVSIHGRLESFAVNVKAIPYVGELPGRGVRVVETGEEGAVRAMHATIVSP